MRFQGDRNPLPTPKGKRKEKKIHKNTKLLDLVTGQAWDTCQRL